MKAIFLGRKPYSCEALKYLISKGVDVVAVVAKLDDEDIYWKTKLSDVAKEYNLNVINDDYLYNAIDNPDNNTLKIDLNNIDIVISYLYWKKIKKTLIDIPTSGCINFHPAPLPELRGVGGYNVAILEGKRYYGVSAHFVDEKLDSGDIIEVKRFDIDPYNETAFSLEQKSQEAMFELFRKIIDNLLEGKELPRSKQSKGRYVNKNEFNELREIKPSDTQEIINRKIRAFWYPPHHGAYLMINDTEYTIIDTKVLKEIGKKYH
ncbi:MAG: formyltransferase family protein [Cyanobacteriota bacterium]